MNNRPGGHGLPARPAFAAPVPASTTNTAGPSQPRARPHSQPQHRSQGNLPVNPSLPAGLYQQTTSYNAAHLPRPPQQSFAGQYQPQVQMQGTSGGYPSQPPVNISGGYPLAYPQYQQPLYTGQMPSAAQTFGQSLFQQHQPYNPSGYAYSSTYLQSALPASGSSMSMTAAQPPTKRQRPNSASLGDASTSQVAGLDGSGGPVQMWRNCSHPGCKFVGPGNEVEIHEGDRHLIFPRGKPVERSEEEERFARRKGPLPPIQGTNITLNTPEDIEKWIAERKARWPSAKRVQEKEEERQAAIARGEMPVRGGRGRGRGRGGIGGGRMDAAYLAEEWGRAPRIPVLPAIADGEGRESEGRSDRGRGRGRERGSGRGRGRGGHTGTDRERDQGWSRADRPNDVLATGLTEATADPVAGSQMTPQSGAAPKPAASGLAGLDGYDTPSTTGESSESESSSESDSDSDSTSSDSSSSDADSDKEHERPQRTAKTELHSSVVSGTQAGVDSSLAVRPSRPMCKFFAKNGRCKNGDKCRFAHSADGATSQPSQITKNGNDQHNSNVYPMEEKKRPPKQPVAKRVNPFERPSMLGSLLANPIENTISQLSQTIRFLVANNFLEGVELNPGDADKEEEEKNKVVQLEGQDHIHDLDQDAIQDQDEGDVAVRDMDDTVETKNGTDVDVQMSVLGNGAATGSEGSDLVVEISNEVEKHQDEEV